MKHQCLFYVRGGERPASFCGAPATKSVVIDDSAQVYLCNEHYELVVMIRRVDPSDIKVTF